MSTVLEREARAVVERMAAAMRAVLPEASDVGVAEMGAVALGMIIADACFPDTAPAEWRKRLGGLMGSGAVIALAARTRLEKAGCEGSA